MHLHIDDVIYLGLVAGEIMMNVFKYTFTDHPSPCLRLIYKMEDEGVVLELIAKQSTPNQVGQSSNRSVQLHTSVTGENLAARKWDV